MSLYRVTHSPLIISLGRRFLRQLWIKIFVNPKIARHSILAPVPPSRSCRNASVTFTSRSYEMSKGAGQNNRRSPWANQPAAPSKYPRNRSHCSKGRPHRSFVLSLRQVPSGLSSPYPLADCGSNSCTRGEWKTNVSEPSRQSHILRSHSPYFMPANCESSRLGPPYALIRLTIAYIRFSAGRIDAIPART